MVEGDAGGHAHAFHVDRHAAVRGHLIDVAFVAAGNVQAPLVVESHTGGVHQFVDERLHAEVEVDAINRDRHFLAARAAEGGVDVAKRIHRGVGHRVQAVGDLHADIAGPRFARLLAAFHYQIARHGAVRHAGNQERIRADHNGRTHFADGDAGPLHLGEAFASNLKLAAGDGGRGRDFGDLRARIRRFPEGHIYLRLEHPASHNTSAA